MIEFLDWLARGTGVIAVLVALLGYMFREKWKQLLQHSLSEDVERLKADLSRTNAEHAASLVPQLEQIKHDFQQKLEAYKVGLIAQAEAAKAQSDLRKTIATRYAEVEFERLVALELVLAPVGTDMLALGTMNVDLKELERRTNGLAHIRELGRVIEQAEMFMSDDDRLKLSEFRGALIDYLTEFVGPQRQSPNADHPLHRRVIQLSSLSHFRL